MFGRTSFVRHNDGKPASGGKLHLRVRRSKSLVILGALFFVSVSWGAERAFNIPAGFAVRTLQLFSQQSGEQILYPVSEVRGFRTNPVRGNLTPRSALDEMLAASGLIAVQDEASGAVVIKRADDLSNAGAARPGIAPPIRRRVSGRAARGSTGSPSDEIVVLSPFEVRSAADLGYKATNAVSATRMAIPISQLPMSISAFTEPFIEDQKAYDLYDIVKWSPGVHQDNVSPQGWVRYNIRGFNSAAVQRNGFGSFRFIDTTNISRVEVVKGPASLLYGQINPGGVINYFTKRPEATAGLELTATTGNFGYDRAVVDATGPIPGTEGRLLYRAIAMTENVQRFQQLARGTKLMLAPSATWRISERTTLTVDYEHFEREEDMLTSGVVLAYVNGVATTPYRGLPWDFSYAGEGDYQNFSSQALTAEVRTQLGEHFDVRAVFLDSRWDMEWRATGQGGTGLIAQSFIDAFYPSTSGLTPADAMYRRNRWEHQWGGERSGQLDIVGRFDLGSVSVRTVVGHKQNFRTHFRGIQKNNPNDATNPLYLKPWDLRDPLTWDRTVPFGTESLLLAADIQNASEGSSTFGVISATAFDERLRVLGGYARHRLHNQPTRNLLTQTSTAATRRAANVPQFGAMVEVREGISAFVSYSESFLANTNMLRVRNVPALPAEPSLGRGWETGLKIDLLEGRISGTLSAYRVKASPTGIVSFTAGVDESGTTLFTDVQGGSQFSEGFEFDLLFTPIAGLQVMVGYSRCDAVYEVHPTDPALNNTPLVAAPDRTLGVWGKYQFRGGPLEGLRIGGGLSYVGSATRVANNPFARIEPHTTFDFTLGYRLRAFGRDWDADVSVKNVTDEKYYVSAASWGFPRHGMLSLSTRF